VSSKSARRIGLCGFLLALAAATARADGGCVAATAAEGGDCGPRAVEAIMHALGMDPPALEALRTATDSDAERTTTIRGILRGLRILGLPHRVVHLGEATPAEPTIVFEAPPTGRSGPGHFVALMPQPGDSSRVIRLFGPGRGRAVPWDVLRQRCHAAAIAIENPSELRGSVAFGAVAGLALLIAVWVHRPRGTRAVSLLVACLVFHACEAGTKAQPGGLVVLPVADLDAGVVGPVSRHSFELLNRGSVPVTVARTVSTCSCAGVDLERSVEPIEPGDRRKVVVTLFTPPGQARTAEVVLVQDSGAGVSIRIRARGAEPQWIASSPRRVFGDLLVGQVTSVTLEVDGPALPRPERDRVAESVAWRTADPGVTRLQSHRVDLDDDASRLTANVELRPSAPGASRTWVTCVVGGVRVPIELNWRASSPLGLSTHVVRLAPTGGGYAARSPLRVQPGLRIGGVRGLNPGLRVEVRDGDQPAVLEVAAERDWGRIGHAEIELQIWVGEESILTPLRLVAPP
jgi:hypothetical protein